MTNVLVTSPVEVNLTLVVIASGLIGCGVYLLLERSLSRVLVGLVMMGNGVSLAFLVAGGPAGPAPIVKDGVETYTDPIPQAMVLTAIVIMLATVSFVLAMAYRSWQLTGHDDVQDDTEDALIRRLAAQDVESDSYRAERSDEDDDEAAASDFTEEELAEAAEAEERLEAERVEAERLAQEKIAADLWSKEKAAQEREARRNKAHGTDDEKGSDA